MCIIKVKKRSICFGLITIFFYFAELILNIDFSIDEF